MKAKAILIIAALCIAAGTAHAQWDGNGTSDSPWLIKTTDDLVTLATNSQSSDYRSKYFRLENDLDMSSVKIGTIGINGKEFGGTFDGNGHAIRNLTISQPDDNYVALFGNISYNCTVRNLILDGADITGRSSVAVLIGYAGLYATIENCLVVNSSVTATFNTPIAGIIVGDYGSGVTLSDNNYYNCNLTIRDNAATTNIGTRSGDRAGAAYGFNWKVLSYLFASTSTDADHPTVLTLADDITAGGSDSYLNLPGGSHVVLDLNGHTIDRHMTEATSDGWVIKVNSGASLTIRDSQGGGTITGGWSTFSGACIVSSSATLTIEGGTITGNRTTNQGGSAISASGTLRISGGTITGNIANTSNNSSAMAGTIYHGGTCQFYLSGGTISGNYCGNTTCGTAGITAMLGGYGTTLHLSGTYTLSGNQMGTYNESTGEWSSLTASDLHNSNRMTVAIDDVISPTEPAALVPNNYGIDNWKATFTTGWATHMGSADPETAFTLDPATGKGLGIVGGEAHVGTLHTLTLADGLTASATQAAQGKSVTLGGASVGTSGGITYTTDYIVSYNDGTDDHTDRYAADALGNATFAMPDADATVSSETVASVAYIDENGDEQTKAIGDVTLVSSTDAFTIDGSVAYLGKNDNTERWYAVVGTVNLDKYLSIRGNTRLILCDGAALNIDVDYYDGFAFYDPSRGFTIYGQAKGTGTLSVTNTNRAFRVNHDVTVNGGTVIATSTGTNYAGIYIVGGTLTINRGTVTATGGVGINIKSGTLTQNGGTLSATGSGTNYAGIYAEHGAHVNILGGTLSATGNDGAYGILAYDDATTVTLGWTTPADRITASSIQLDTSYGTPTLQVASGQTLTDGTDTYTGELNANQIAAIAGKTLRMSFDPAEGTKNLTTHQATLAGQTRYWTTFYHPMWSYTLPAGAQAFILKSDKALYRVGDGTIVPAGCAVVIMAESASITLTATNANAPAVSGSILRGASTATAAPSGAHVLSKVSEAFGFFTFTGTIPANKAYYVE